MGNTLLNLMKMATFIIHNAPECHKRPKSCPTTKKTPHEMRGLRWVEVGSGFEPIAFFRHSITFQFDITLI